MFWRRTRNGRFGNFDGRRMMPVSSYASRAILLVSAEMLSTLGRASSAATAGGGNVQARGAVGANAAVAAEQAPPMNYILS